MSENVATDALHFDRNNPRLAEYGITPGTPESEILKILWEEMDVRELVQSIAASGYFRHEPLIVAQEKNKQVVIEGNRRLAAVKVLLDPSLASNNGWEIPSLDQNARNLLKELPVIFESREQSWRYLGFKHVNGPAKWSSYAKAKYIAEVHDLYKVPLSNIAEQIGDRHQTVQRLYRGLMVIDQAERMNVYHRDDRYRQRFAFSHLYTGLDGDGISSFLGIKDAGEEVRDPVPKSKKNELGEFCVWLYGSKKKDQPPIVQKQNPDLWRLNTVLGDREALSALRAGVSLESALELSRPQGEILEEALLAAKRELMRVRAAIPIGYRGEEELIRIAGTVAQLADNVYDEMEKMRGGVKKNRMTE